MVKNWQFPMLWTLTLNPRAYPDQRRIWEFIYAKRLVSRWVQELDRKELLVARDWYSVAEFQMGERKSGGRPTEQAHWHVLVNAKRPIPHDLAWRLWEQMAPEWRVCGQVCQRPGVGDGPAMGVVQFERVKKVTGIGKYLTKYLAKGPAALPDWYTGMIDEGKNIRLRQSSRGFFKSLKGIVEKPQEEFGDVEEEPEAKPAKQKSSAPRKVRSLEDRIAACKHDGDICVETTRMGVEQKDHNWVSSTFETFEESLEKLDLTESQREDCRKAGRCVLTPEEVVRIAGAEAYSYLERIVEGDNLGPDAEDPNFRYVMGPRKLRKDAGS